MNVIGLDLGGTKVAGAIYANEKIMHKEVALIHQRKGKQVSSLILQLIDQLLKLSTSKTMKIDAIGISVPGIYHANSGKVWAPNISGWQDYPLLKEVQSFLTDKSIKTGIDSDRACSILGETWRGASRGAKNVIFLAVGTGIGAGILIDGKILRGHQDIAGAVGWQALDRPFQSCYKDFGCFEYHASGDGIARIAQVYLDNDPRYFGILRRKESQQLVAQDVFSAFQKNDPIAKKVLTLCIEFWGMASANLISIFNPEMLVFGGGVFGPAKQFLEQIRHEATKWAQPVSIKTVKFNISTLGGDAALYGAVKLALQTIE